MTTTREGGCLCGAVRYRVTGAPLIGGACYCRDCQQVSGGAEAHGEMYPTEALEILQGQTRTFTLTAGSGNQVHRLFCPDCGTQLFGWNSAAPALRSIKVGTLDDPSGYASQGSIWVSSAQPWHRPDPGLPQHPTMPCLADLAEG